MDVPTPSHDDLLLPFSPSSESPLPCSASKIHRLPTSNLTLSSCGPDSTPAATTVLNPIPLPAPRSSQVVDALTPIAEPSLTDLTFATIAAPALPPFEPVQRPSLAKSLARNLRLPSFEVLGIAAPHPDRKYAIHNPDIQDLLPDIGTLIQNHQRSKIAELTPNPSPPDRPMGPSGKSAIQKFIFCAQASGGSNPEASSLVSETGAAEHQMLAADNRPEPENIDTEPGSSTFNRPSEPLVVADIVSQVVSMIRPRASYASSSQIKILTHALPLPSTDGYCFPQILSQIHGMLSPERTTWISHWHAVSGRYNLSQLPTTPPSTPAAPHEGEDYFTTRVFDAAVPVPDYQQPDTRPLQSLLTRGSLSSAPSTSPRPAVPPLSMEISITERYIPPTASSEFVNLFEPTSGRSLLSDRLVELSEESGSMVFIYPTREGGRVFVREYLGRVLDPLLRRMMIVRQLGVDVCERIGRMPAVEEMPTFEELKARIGAFCQRISSETKTPAGTFNRFTSSSGSAVNYSLVLATRNSVSLAADVWTDWWCRQEKSRIRAEFDKYLRENPGRARAPNDSAGNIPSNSRSRMREDSTEVGSMSYILEIMDGVTKGAKQKASQLEGQQIEVGVFVIRKEIVREMDEARAMR